MQTLSISTPLTMKLSILRVLAGAISQVAGAVLLPISATIIPVPASLVPAPLNSTIAVKSGSPPQLTLYENKGFTGQRFGPYYFGTEKHRSKRVAVFGDCIDLSKWGWHNAVTSYSVVGMCCSFFSDGQCSENRLMFRARNRNDWEIKGAHNDALGSIKCFLENCG